jgi:CrcB protein
VVACDLKWRAMQHTLLVALGGLIGSVARYWIASFAQRLGGGTFPVGTLTVNVLGSFVLGLVMMLYVGRGSLSPGVGTFLAIGVCGGFTTMSTFSYETVVLLRDGGGALAFGNVLATVAACCAAVWLGQTFARIL